LGAKFVSGMARCDGVEYKERGSVDEESVVALDNISDWRSGLLGTGGGREGGGGFGLGTTAVCARARCTSIEKSVVSLCVVESIGIKAHSLGTQFSVKDNY
jgi:hypothetical protein